MTDIIFSSWQGEVVDNREAGDQERREPKVRLPADFRPGEKIKAFMAWDGIVLRDNDVDIVDLCANYAEAVQSESCGRCFPCRVGSRVVGDWLKQIASGQGKPEHIQKIRALAANIRDAALCSIGQTGLRPILQALDHFPQAFASAIEEGKKARPGKYRYAVTAPCRSVCPTNLDIPQYVQDVREHKFFESLDRIRENACLAGTLGRVCVRPCESSCRRENIDESIAIKYLKRFVADYEIERKGKPGTSNVDESIVAEYLKRFGIDYETEWKRKPEIAPGPKSGKKAAIIGAGPAGLTCAYYLALRGHQATVFERLPEPGGMAAVGIPDYRLPRDILRGEVDRLRELGVELRYNVQVGKDISFADLRRDCDAVFIGVGAQGSSPMGVEGEDKNYEGFIPGVKYLLDINQGKDPYPAGKKVLVVGGGNVAIDCVRSSFRIGKIDVNLVYRRSKAEMPADPVEIRDAEEERVNFHYLCNPTKIIAKEGKVTAVECIRMELGEPDQSGRRRPVPVPGSEFLIETDILIPAIGQKVDLSFLDPKDGVKLSRWNTVESDSETMVTSQPGVFAAGDCVTGPDVLVRASGNGRRAAEMIDLYLAGKPVEPSVDDTFRSLFSAIKVYDKDEDLGILGGKPKTHLRMLDPEERKHTFREVEEGFKVNEAINEAARCLRCYRIGMIALS